MVGVRPTEPIPEQQIYEAICKAASQDPFVMRFGTERLQSYVDHPGTWERLHAIAAEKGSVPLDVRRMAIIQFKNGALSSWKNKRLFNKGWQDSIRGRLMPFLSEEDNIIAGCNAIIVAKIARNDFPSQWPSLIPDLSTIVQTQVDIFLSNPINSDSASTLLLRRTLAVLYQTIKEFTSIKMLGGIRTMAQIADALYSPLISYYARFSGLLKTSFTITSLMNPALQRACEDISELTHMIFKSCVKIMLWLWQRSGQPQFLPALQTLSLFSQSCFQLAREFFELRVCLVVGLRQAAIGTSSSPGQGLPTTALKPIEVFTKHIKLYGKMFRRMQQLFSRRFIGLPGANDFVLYCWAEVVKAASGPSDLIEDSTQAVYPTRLLVQGMVLFREGLNVWSGRNQPDKRIDVLSPPSIEDAVRLLMARFIALTPGDLEMWSATPEDWVCKEENNDMAWEFEIRPCGERVLLTLCTHYEDIVVPVLLGMLQHALATPANDLISILQKEAVYCAIGRCANRLFDKLHLDGWLQTHLLAEAQETNPNYRIIKRRIAWVIGRWHADLPHARNTRNVWEVLRHLMQGQGASSDLVVRLSAAEALRECIDIVEFDAEMFSPYIGDFLSQLVQLLDTVDTWETKNRLAKTLNVVIERSEARIAPYTDLIINTLSQLWQSADESAEGYLFKASMIVTVTCLVEAIKEQSSAVSHIVVTLLQESFASNARFHLGVDGQHLWLIALRNTTMLDGNITNSPGYVDMFPHAIFLLSNDLDSLPTALGAVESYLILDANRILSMYGQQLFEAFVFALSNAVAASVKEILLVINLITQLTPATLWAEAMHTSGLFAVLVKTVIDGKEKAVLLAEYIYIFARMALSDPVIFNQLVVGAAPAVNLSETQTFEGLLDQWWSKFDCMTYPEHRKLTAMGIASWVSTGRPEVLDRLYSEIFNLWLDVFGELKEALSDSPVDQSPLTMFWRNSLEERSGLLPDGVENTPEAERRRAIFRQDPVNTVKLTTFILEKLQQAEVACGGSEMFKTKYLNKTDATVLQLIMDALTMTA